jgi:cobyrinic acid a,c-diamide synthase
VWNGLTIKGHEFHYSSLTDLGLTPAPAVVTNAKGVAVPAPLYRLGNVWASYVHLYWGENPAFIEALLAGPASASQPG